MESELTRVQCAVAVAEGARMKAESEREAAQKALSLAREVCTKAEEENSSLKDERLSLILELGTLKDDFAALREKAVADREAMEVEFDVSGGTLFNYSYGCGVFTHNICGSKPQILDGMPDPSVPLTPEFFTNPRCPPPPPQAPRLLFQPRIQLLFAGRNARGAARPPPERRRLFRWVS